MKLLATLLLASMLPVGRAEAVTIGLVAPLSGPDAVFGDQLKLGVQQAVADLDADGGFNGEPGHVVLGDDADEAKTGSGVAQRFLAQHVPIVIGPFSSAVAVPVSATFADAGVLDLTPSATAPLVTERHLETVFRLAAREDAQAAAAARYIKRHFARVAIVHDRTSSGKALADAVRGALAPDGTKEVFYGSVDKGAHDVSGLVGRLKTSGAQVLVWGGGASEAGLIARQIKDAGLHVALIGGYALGSDEFAAAAGPAADGALVVFPRDPRSGPAAAGLLRRLEAKGQNPGGFVFSAYAAVQVVAQAARAAKSLDPRTLAQILHAGTTFRTVVGDIAFDANGDLVAPNLAIYVWHRGASGRMAIDEEAAA